MATMYCSGGMVRQGGFRRLGGWRALAATLAGQLGWVRLPRACGTSAVSGPAQLGAFVLLTHLAWSPPMANAIALLIATQLSFVLSCVVIWPDRGGAWTRLLRRWIGFQGSGLATSVLNMLLFMVMRMVLPDLVALVLASGIGALSCYMLNDLLIFRTPGPTVVAVRGLRPATLNGSG